MSKTDFVIKLRSFSRKSTSNKTKYLEVQKKLNPLTARIYITSNDGSHNIFIHHPSNTWNVRIKKDKGTGHILIWELKGLYNSKLKTLYTAFLHSIKLSGYRIEIKFDKDSLAVEPSNKITKIGNVYIVYHLDAWPRNPTNNFKFNNFLFGATSIVKNSDKENNLYKGYGVTFDCAFSWSFDTDTARNCHNCWCW